MNESWQFRRYWIQRNRFGWLTASAYSGIVRDQLNACLEMLVWRLPPRTRACTALRFRRRGRANRNAADLASIFMTYRRRPMADWRRDRRPRLTIVATTEMSPEWPPQRRVYILDAEAANASLVLYTAIDRWSLQSASLSLCPRECVLSLKSSKHEDDAREKSRRRSKIVKMTAAATVYRSTTSTCSTAWINGKSAELGRLLTVGQRPPHVDGHDALRLRTLSIDDRQGVQPNVNYVDRRSLPACAATRGSI